MLLRTRVALIVTLGLLVLTGGLLLAGHQREQTVESRRQEETFQNQTSLWNKIVERQMRDLHRLGDMMSDDRLLQALTAGDPATIRRYMADRLGQLPGGTALDQLDLVDPKGEVIFSTATGFPPPTLLDAGTVGRIVRTGTGIDAFQQDANRRYRATAALPLRAADQVVGILALASDGDRAIAELRQGIGADSFIVNLRGRIAHGTSAVLARIGFDLPVRQTGLVHRDNDGKVYQIASVPLLDDQGRVTGGLVTVKDATGSVRQAETIGWITLATIALVVVFVVGFLNWYLARSFRPLDSAIGALNALSRGDTMVHVETTQDDEIGRIGAAVEVFRDHARALERFREERERQRRRQERLIRRQMLALADTLDEEARREVLNDLQAIVAQQGGGMRNDEDQGDNQLGLLAAVLKQLCSRMLADIAERRKAERIRDTFGKYIDPRIVESLIDDPTIGGQKRVMTVSFADMQGFTKLSERLSPTELVALLNDYLSLMSQPIKDEHGIVDKFMGDAVMAFWGPPFTADAGQARGACLAAIEQRREVQAWVSRLIDTGRYPPELSEVDIRCGVATGELIVGSIGSQNSRTYTVLGDTANLASRLETANKAMGTRMLVAGRTRELAGAAIETRRLEPIIVVGKSEPVQVFELLGEPGRVEDTLLRLRDRFEHGLERYFARDWPAAIRDFESCLTFHADDGPTHRLLARCLAYRDAPPPESWSGTWHLTDK